MCAPAIPFLLITLRFKIILQEVELKKWPKVSKKAEACKSKNDIFSSKVLLKRIFCIWPGHCFLKDTLKPPGHAENFRVDFVVDNRFLQKETEMLFFCFVIENFYISTLTFGRSTERNI